MIPYLFRIKKNLFGDIERVPDALDKSYYPSLDGLRAIAILSVLVRHFAFTKSWNVWVDGTIGVDIFFIISGFLITTLLLKERIRKGEVSLKNFYIRRILRIVPVAYLYIFILLVLNRIFQLDISDKSFLTSVFYLKNFPHTGDWYTGHFWTLSVEEQFYLLAPIILITNINRYIKIILLFFILVPVADYLGFHNVGVFYSIHWVHVITFIFLAMFNQGTLYILLGSLFSILIYKKILVIEKFSKYYFLSAICFILAFLCHYCYWIGLIPYIPSILFGLLMAFVIALNLYENNFLTKILSNPVLVKLGVLSYSIYVWQQMFTNHQPWKGKFNNSDSFVLNLVALLIVATCSYYFFELKFLQLKKRFK